MKKPVKGLGLSPEKHVNILFKFFTIFLQILQHQLRQIHHQFQI